MPPPARERGPGTPVAFLLPARGEPRVVARDGRRALVVAGGLRAVVTNEREVELAEDAFAGAIVDVVGGGEDGFLFRDSFGTVAGSSTFLGSLERAHAISGPALVSRSPSGALSATFGGPPQPVGVPSRGRVLALASRSAGLAWSEGGFLYRTTDGGGSWELVAAGVGAEPPYVHALAEIRVRIEARAHRLSASGELSPVDDEPPPSPLTPRERSALDAALARARPRPSEARAPRFHLAGARVEVVGRARAAVALEREVIEVAGVRSPCPSTDPSWLTQGLSPVHRITPYQVDLADGAVTPLCPELAERARVTRVLLRGDDGFALLLADERGRTSVAVEGDDRCAVPRALPAPAEGACFVDAERAVAWSPERSPRLWHTDDGGRSWEPLRLVPDGGEALALGPSAVADGSSCTIDDRVVVRWQPGHRPARVVAPEGARAGSCERPPDTALLCRAGAPSAPPAPPSIVTRCRSDRCEVRSASRRFSVATERCAAGSPVLHVEEVTPRGMLVSCASEGVECACEADGYWVRDDGATPLFREVTDTTEVVALPDGGLVVRRDRAFGGVEEVLHFGAAGELIAERAFRWLDPWPRAVVVRQGVPHLGVLTEDHRAMDLLRLGDGGAADRVPLRWGPPRRACGAGDDAGTRLRTELPLVAIVWEGDSRGESAATLDLRLREDAPPCLEQAVLRLDDGAATLGATSASTLAGVLRTSSGTTPITCALFSAERRGDIVAP